MSWYKTGQIAVTNGSRVVVGVGTNFTRFVEVGEALLGPDGQHYEITSVPSATELRIGKNYAGPTAANQSYTIVPVQGYVRELAHKAADLIDAHKGVPAEALSHAEAAAQSAAEAQAANIGVKEARDAAAESAASAAASATAAAGTVSQVADLASQAQTSATAASGSATSASSSKTAAEAAATSATASATQANASKVYAEASATSASTSATAAANSSSQALAHSESAAVSATTARTAADEAVTSNQSAGASATAAGNSATQSQTSATAAAASAAEALSSAQSAASSRADAEAAAVSAQNRAALAAGYASSSTSSASEAAISAAKSTASATEAASSATAAANSSAQALTRANAAGASATLAEQSSQTAQAFKAAAEASAGAAADSAADSAAAASLSEGFSIQAGESASDAAASALLAKNANAAAQAEAAIVQAASTSAQAAATAASTSATNAATSADAASQSELASGMSEIAAAASEASAQAAKTTAELAKNAAASSAVESAASAAAALASKEGAEAVVNTVNEARDAALAHTATAKAWADKVDGEVEPGKYSARYWAEITAGAATGGVVYMGTWSAAGGVFPINPDRGHLYKVSVAGEIAGESYSVKDMIIFNGESWDKIDSTDEVTSVAGRVGAVLLTKVDVGLENVDNTADLAKPVSAPQQAALNQKQDTLVSGESIKRLNGESLLGSGDVTISKTSLGLGNVDNTADLDKPVSTAQRAALDQKQNILVSGESIKTLNGTPLLGGGDIAISKATLGLENVNNTADLDKPVSTATQNALSAKEGAIASGTAAQYWRGDKTWRDFFTDVRSATLTGMSTATNAVVAATDTVLAAIGKLQAQITAHFGSGGAAHSAATSSVNGFMSGADKAKLDAIAAGATANSTDAQLRDRATHTGAQAIETVSGLRGELDNKQPIDDDLTAIAALTGTSGLLKKTSTNTWSLDTAAYLTDAPSDGKIYGRKDSVWTEVVAGGSEDTTTSFTYTYTGVMGMPPIPLPSSGSGALFASPTGNERAFNVLFFGTANPGLTGIEFTRLEVIAGSFSFSDMAALVSLNFPALTTIGGSFNPNNMNALTNLSVPALTIIGASVYPSNLGALTSLNLPALTTIVGSFQPNSLGALTSLNLPSLTTIGYNFQPSKLNALTGLSLPALKTTGGSLAPSSMNALTSLSVPAIERIGASVTSGDAIQLTGGMGALTTFMLPATLKQVGGTAGNVTITSAALNQASVDSILIRLAALNGTGGTVSFSNRVVTITGTSAAPSSAGLAAKATLVARGCTVTHK